MEFLKECAKFLVSIGMWVIGIFLGIIGFFALMVFALVAFAILAEVLKVLMVIIVPLFFVAALAMLTVKMYQKLFVKAEPIS